MLRTHRAIVLMIVIALLASACGSGSSPSSASAASGESSEVPEVEGMELRAAVKKIESEGFVAELSTELGSAEYVATLEEYLEDGSMQMSPATVVGATEPEGGSDAEKGSRVVVTRLKCPDGLRECD